MKDSLWEQETKIRFNFQNWLKEDISESDVLRIGNVLNISENIITEHTQKYDRIIEAQAGLLDTNGRYSSLAERTHDDIIIFIGDSITSDRLSYANIIRKVFSYDHKLCCINVGVSGWRTTDFVDEFYLKVLSRGAKYAHIMLGTNDVRRSKFNYGKSNLSAGEFRDNLNYLLTALFKHNTSVIISTLPPYHLDTDTYINGNWTINQQDYNEFNEIICGCASRTDVIVNDMRDIYDSYHSKELLEDDGVHLNSKGHYLLADSVIEKLIIIMSKKGCL